MRKIDIGEKIKLRNMTQTNLTTIELIVKLVHFLDFVQQG